MTTQALKASVLSCPEQLCYNDVTSQLYVIHGSERGNLSCDDISLLSERGNPSCDDISLLSEWGNPSCDDISLLSERGNPSCDVISLLSERGNPLRLRRVALRSAPVTCATVVAHSLMQRLRQRARSKFSWITRKRRTRGLSHVT